MPSRTRVRLSQRRRLLLDAPASLQDVSVRNIGGGTPRLAGLNISSDGNVYPVEANGAVGTTALFAWLGAGASAGDYWVEKTVTTGTLNTDQIATRQSLASGSYTIDITTTGTAEASGVISLYGSATSTAELAGAFWKFFAKV